MKQFFYVLVVLNLVFLVWKFGIDQRNSLVDEINDQHLDVEVQGDSGVPANAEYEMLPTSPETADPAVAELAGAAALPEEASSRGCFEVGPVQDRETAEAYLGLLSQTAKGARLVIRAGDVPDGWWVVYPKATTLEAARANRQMVLNRGIRETWLFEQGPLKNAVSLGLYQTREEAIKQQQLLVEQGLPVKVEPRLVRGDVFWIKMPWTKLPLLLEEAIHTLNSQDPGLRMPAPLACQ
jgi:hypothetical protein